MWWLIIVPLIIDESSHHSNILFARVTSNQVGILCTPYVYVTTLTLTGFNSSYPFSEKNPLYSDGECICMIRGYSKTLQTNWWMSTRTEQSLSSKVRNCFVRPQSSPSISLAPGLHHNQSILCTFMTRAVGKHKISIREPVMSTGKVKINKYWMSKKSWILEIYISYILDKSKVMNTGKVKCHEYWKSHSARALEKS